MDAGLHSHNRDFIIEKWALPGCWGAVALQLSDEELGYGSETVAHAVNVSALGAQDAREGVSETLDFQQKNMVKRVLHVGQLVH